MEGTTKTNKQLSVQVRLLGMACFALPVTALYVVVVFWRTGEFPGHRWWEPILAVPVFAVVCALVWQYGPGRLLANVFGHLGWMAVGLWFPEDAVISRESLRGELDSLTLPPNFRRTGERAAWSRWHGEFTDYTRHWVATGEPGDVRAQLHKALLDRSFVVGEWGTDPAEPNLATAEAVRDRLRLRVCVDARHASDDGRRELLAPGHLGVTAVLHKH